MPSKCASCYTFSICATRAAPTCPAPAGLEQGLRPARPYPCGAAPLGTGLYFQMLCSANIAMA
eukprot:1020082-Alexandrium_andersonii.AAC.1